MSSHFEIKSPKKMKIHEATKEERFKKFRETGAAPIQAGKVKPKIQRVPPMLRDDNNLDKYYEPSVAAFGPFHHGRKHKYEYAEKVKLKLAANFVKDSKQNDADLLKTVEDNINKLRECYDEEATKDYDDEYLAWMLFVDGCSTLEFIYKHDRLEIKRDMVAFLEQDLFLLENQLPYQLLQLLMRSRHVELKKSIDNFVKMVAGAPQNPEAEQRSQPGQDLEIPVEAEPTHLLKSSRHVELKKSIDNFVNMVAGAPQNSKAEQRSQPGQYVEIPVEAEPTHLLKSSRHVELKKSVDNFVNMAAGAPQNPKAEQRSQPGQYVEIPVEAEPTHLLKSSRHVELKKSIDYVVNMAAGAPQNPEAEQSSQPGQDVEIPMVACRRTRRQRVVKISNDDVVNMAAGAPQNPEAEQTSQPGQDVEAEPTHLLELLLKTMLRRSPSNESEETGGTYRHHYFRNVLELHAAGIQFKPSEDNSLRSIYFNYSHLGRGILRLPQILVDDSTRPKFMNLIAYEMCPDFDNDFGVTSYICFLDSIIDHPDDVKHLRKNQILLNMLGNDEEVAKVFNEIGTDLVPNNDIYCGVKNQIEEHYKKPCNTVMAQFCHEHFSSPWTVIAFLGVLLALGLTIAQTVYSVLGYHFTK